MLQENQQTLLSSFWVPRLSEPKLSQLIQLSENGRGHLHTPPSLRCSHQGGEEEPEATGLCGEAGDHLGPPPPLAKGPLQQVGGSYVAVIFPGERKVGQTLLQILGQALHGRGEAALKTADQAASLPVGDGLILSIEDLLKEGLDGSHSSLGELGQDVTHLMDQTPLEVGSRENLADGLPLPRDPVRKPWVSIGDDQEGLSQTSTGEVVEEGQPGIVGFAAPQGQVDEDLLPFLSDPVLKDPCGIGTKNPLLLRGTLSDGVIVPVEEEVDHLQMREISPPPLVEGRAQPSGDAAHLALGEHRLAKDLSVEVLDVPGGEAPDVSHRDPVRTSPPPGPGDPPDRGGYDGPRRSGRALLWPGLWGGRVPTSHRDPAKPPADTRCANLPWHVAGQGHPADGTHAGSGPGPERRSPPPRPLAAYSELPGGPGLPREALPPDIPPGRRWPLASLPHLVVSFSWRKKPPLARGLLEPLWFGWRHLTPSLFISSRCNLHQLWDITCERGQ